LNKQVKNFTDLEVWKSARELRKEIYKIVEKLPEIEKYGLRTQMCRAAVSITANIAEGYGRFHFKETIQFSRQARGSIYELHDHLITCLDLGYINESVFNELVKERIEKTIQLINGYIRYLDKANKNYINKNQITNNK
jgi:four helix bundle protein